MMETRAASIRSKPLRAVGQAFFFAKALGAEAWADMLRTDLPFEEGRGEAPWAAACPEPEAAAAGPEAAEAGPEAADEDRSHHAAA